MPARRENLFKTIGFDVKTAAMRLGEHRQNPAIGIKGDLWSSHIPRIVALNEYSCTPSRLVKNHNASPLRSVTSPLKLAVYAVNKERGKKTNYFLGKL